MFTQNENDVSCISLSRIKKILLNKYSDIVDTFSFVDGKNRLDDINPERLLFVAFSTLCCGVYYKHNPYNGGHKDLVLDGGFVKGHFSNAARVCCVKYQGNQSNASDSEIESFVDEIIEICKKSLPEKYLSSYQNNEKVELDVFEDMEFDEFIWKVKNCSAVTDVVEYENITIPLDCEVYTDDINSKRRVSCVFYNVICFDFEFVEGKIKASLILSNKQKVTQFRLAGLSQPTNSDELLSVITDYCRLRLSDDNLAYYD